MNSGTQGDLTGASFMASLYHSVPLCQRELLKYFPLMKNFPQKHQIFSISTNKVCHRTRTSLRRIDNTLAVFDQLEQPRHIAS